MNYIMNSPFDKMPSKEEIEERWGKIPTDDEIGFIIHDQSSKILPLIPEAWRIPLTIIAFIKQYESVDSYVLELIRSRLEMFSDSRDELDEYFQDYMGNIEGLEGLNSKEKYVEVPIESDVLKKFQKVIDRDKQQQDTNDEDSNEKKFVQDVNDANYEMRKQENQEKEDLK